MHDLNETISHKENLFGLNVLELREFAQKHDFPPHTGNQIASWIYKQEAADFSVMTDISEDNRDLLWHKAYIDRGRCLTHISSKDGLTTKYLMQFIDGIAVETVLMRQSYGNSICISTQAGCNVQCRFCASTQRGLERSLTHGEMLAETLYINNLLKKEDKKVDTIVLMGMGEPLLNYDNVLRYIRLLHEPYTLNLGYRNITLSTSGIIPGIRRLINENIPLNLAISLHAADQETRLKIMPVSEAYPIDEVVDWAGQYATRTKRRITYEYIMIKDLNDSIEDAKKLVKLIKGQLASVNLIPINPVSQNNFERPPRETVLSFKEYLDNNNISCTIRKEMGEDINAACGQLRNRNIHS